MLSNRHSHVRKGPVRLRNAASTVVLRLLNGRVQPSSYGAARPSLRAYAAHRLRQQSERKAPVTGTRR